MLVSAIALAATLLAVQDVAADDGVPGVQPEALSADDGSDAGDPDAGDSDEGDSEQGDADEEPPEPALDDTLTRYRTPFGTLMNRTIGTTSRPVKFNWRRSTVQVAAMGNHLFELNNFNSLRAGGLVRAPAGGAIIELGVSYVWVWDTPSSELLAYTPYRQPGRAKRLEFDLTLGLPLAEGVVTTAPRVFPAVELVFNAYAGLRYLYYPGAFDGLLAREVAAAIFSPMFTDTELENLDDRRLDAMQVDTGRYGLMAGFGNDIYFKQGVFVSPRLMLAVPVLAPASGTDLLLWADLSITVGVAF